MMARLFILSLLEVLALVAALIYFLIRIAETLDRVGGSADSYLAKIAFGVRAIEKESSHLGPQVTQLNQALASLADGFAVVDRNLRVVAEALSPGKEGAA